MQRALGFVVLIAVLATASPARSQPATSPEDYRALFEAGKKAFRLGDYDEAIRAWREGYRLKGDPKFLYNLGQAHREKGDLDKAVHFLRAYLREEKDAPNREAVETRITEMEALIAARDAERVKPPNGPFDADGRATPAGPEPAATRRRPNRGLQIGGATMAGAGMISLGAGIVFVLQRNAAEDDIAAAVAAGRSWDAELQAADDRGRRAARLAPIFGGLGAGAIVAGGVLFYLGTRGRVVADERSAWVPVISHGGAGVVFTGSF